MSWDVDEKEFYETFAEITEDRGIEEAKRWVWSALDWTQQELRKEAAKSQSIVAEERAAVVAWLYRDGCEASAERIERGEHRREEAVCAHGNTECRRCGVGPGCGEHRRGEKE